MGRLGDDAPDWFGPLAEDLGERCSPAVATRHLRKIVPLAKEGMQAEVLVAALRSSGRSPGATARLVDEFFDRTGAGSHLVDEDARRTAGRQHRRLMRVPERLRPTVVVFAQYLRDSRTRAALVGGRGLQDGTIEARLADIAALSIQLTQHGITDWASVSVADIEEFTQNRRHRLASCRTFFAFARRRKLVLVNPTARMSIRRPHGFAGRTLNVAEQHQLLRRWIRPDIDPREAVVGFLSLLHGATSAQMRDLKLADVSLGTATMELHGRPHRVPLDPLTATAIGTLIAHRATLITTNPHLIITKDSRMHSTASSAYFMTHILDNADVTPALLRQTRLADLAHKLDPRLVAAAFGMTPGGALHYVIDAVDNEEEAFSPHL